MFSKLGTGGEMGLQKSVLIVGLPCLAVLALLLPWRFIAFVVVLLLSSPCGNDIVQDAVAPDGTRRAVVFQRDCGATTGFSTQVAVVWGSGDLPDKPANVFIADGHPDRTKTYVRWLNSATLVIGTKALADAHKAERHVNGVSVTYERR
ncbi:MAG TPA: hypothetical protein EYH07_19590 [Kiloniellaceae bacterium]|nr:hypothetical protein [Kiloniellaceae bacterium]